MEVDENLKSDILKEVKPIIESAIAKVAVAAVGGLIASFVATNISRRGLTGDTNIHPTEETVIASKADIAASEAEGKLAQDKVTAVEGEVKASEMDATAASGEATAAESGAAAMRTKAGAADIETKGLKMT